MGTLLAVCAVHQLLPDDDLGVTAIDKRALPGRVRVRPLGAHGDVQADRRHHGGPDKALYAYAQEAADAWAAELQREVAPGLFGENLRTSGVDVDGAEVGERWWVGPAGAAGAAGAGGGDEGIEVEVTMPRVPCMTFARRMKEDRWVKRFARSGHPGAYLRVLRPGTVAAGDEVRVLSRPGHGVTVGRWLVESRPDDARTLLALGASGSLRLAPDLVEYLEPVSRR